MPKGIISQIDPAKDHGFIEQEDGSQVFFYKSAIIARSPEINVGDAVTFDISSDGKGVFATNIRKSAVLKSHKGLVSHKEKVIAKLKSFKGRGGGQ